MTISLKQELKQARAFRSRAHEATLSIVRTAALLNDQLEQVLKPFGLTLAQYNVLRILRGAEPAVLGRNDIRCRMVTRMTDMTRLLDRMERAGMVVRARCDEDRRQVLTSLTPRSRELLDELDPLMEAEHRRHFRGLNNGELAELVTLLTAVRNPG